VGSRKGKKIKSQKGKEEEKEERREGDFIGTLSICARIF
jgi:hypothetical protein